METVLELGDRRTSGSWRNVVLLFTFIESVGTVLLERGLYFYTHERLQFGSTENLGLALLHGVLYVLGALKSHAWARRLGERRGLLCTLIALFFLHTLLAVWPSQALLLISFPVLGVLHGLKWPIVESYVSAGLGPRAQALAIGRFNVTWALAVPLSVACSGPLIASRAPWLLFAGAAAFNVVALGLLRAFPKTPAHLAESHPDLPPPELVAFYRPLLISSRWSLVQSYAFLFLLAPLLPQVFQRLGQGVDRATLFAAWLDAVRVVTFALLSLSAWWHGARLPLVVSAFGLPIGLIFALFGSSLSAVVGGELLFGIASGIAYQSALYYAMVEKNAAVDAAGTHEGLIGAGFALGPAAGLVGQALTSVGDDSQSAALGAVPLALVCLVGGLVPFLRRTASAAG